MSPIDDASASVPERRPSRLREALPYLLVAVAAAIVYVNTLGNGFVFDDRVFIEKARAHRHLSNLPHMFGLDDGTPAYRPVRLATYAIDHAVFGPRPWGFHLSNIVYHVAASILVLLLFRRLTGGRWAATAGALLFALHPIHVDAVTYISGRKDVLVTLFTLGALLAYVAWRRSPRRTLVRTTAATAGVCLLFVLGILSKESAVVLPALVLLTEAGLRLSEARAGDRPRESWTRLAAASFRGGGIVLLSLVLLAAAGCWYVLFVHKGTHQGWHGGNPAANFATASRVLAYYVYLTTLPVRLVGDYYPETFPLSRGFLEPAVLGSCLLLAALVATLFRFARRAPWVWLGGMWFFLALLPVAQIVPHHELVGERFLYLPSVGFCLIGAVALDRIRTARSERLAVAILAVVACLFATRIVTRNLDYRNDRTFWTAVSKAAPRNARAYINLGYNTYYAGNAPEAVGLIEKGLAIDPRYFTGHYNLARVYERLGRYTEAIEQYREELRLYEDRDARFNLASLLGRMGRIDESAREFERLVERFPRAHEGHYYLGICREALGDREGALASYREAIRLAPKFKLAADRLAALEKTGEPPVAPEGSASPPPREK